MKIRLGNYDYIIYPAFFILLFAIFILFLVLLVIKNVLKEKKQENNVNKNYEITNWQKKYLGSLIENYLESKNYMDKYGYVLDLFNDYVSENKYWNVDELIELDNKFVQIITLLLFEISKGEYLNNHYDNSVLILHSMDFINGGMDNPDYFGGNYPWIGDDIPEMKNHADMTDEETRTIYMYYSAVESIFCLVDEDLEKIPENANVLDFCKRFSMHQIDSALIDISSVIDIKSLKKETRDIIAKSLFNNISFLLGEIFGDKNEESYSQYVDEYRRYSIRALASAIDNQLYSLSCHRFQQLRL